MNANIGASPRAQKRIIEFWNKKSVRTFYYVVSIICTAGVIARNLNLQTSGSLGLDHLLINFPIGGKKAVQGLLISLACFSVFLSIAAVLTTLTRTGNVRRRHFGIVSFFSIGTLFIYMTFAAGRWVHEPKKIHGFWSGDLIPGVAAALATVAAACTAIYAVLLSSEEVRKNDFASEQGPQILRIGYLLKEIDSRHVHIIKQYLGDLAQFSTEIFSLTTSEFVGDFGPIETALQVSPEYGRPPAAFDLTKALISSFDEKTLRNLMTPIIGLYEQLEIELEKMGIAPRTVLADISFLIDCFDNELLDLIGDRKIAQSGNDGIAAMQPVVTLIFFGLYLNLIEFKQEPINGQAVLSESLFTNAVSGSKYLDLFKVRDIEEHRNSVLKARLLRKYLIEELNSVFDTSGNLNSKYGSEVNSIFTIWTQLLNTNRAVPFVKSTEEIFHINSQMLVKQIGKIDLRTETPPNT